MIRFVLAVLAGIALSFIGVIAVEFFSEAVYPAPAEYHSLAAAKAEAGSAGEAAAKTQAMHEVMCRHVEGYPSWVLGVVTLMWLAIVYAATRVAAHIGSRSAGGMVAGVLLVMLGLNLAMLPYAIWFPIAMLVGFPVVVWLALRQPPPAERPRTVGKTTD